MRGAAQLVAVEDECREELHAGEGQEDVIGPDHRGIAGKDQDQAGAHRYLGLQEEVAPVPAEQRDQLGRKQLIGGLVRLQERGEHREQGAGHSDRDYDEEQRQADDLLAGSLHDRRELRDALQAGEGQEGPGKPEQDRAGSERGSFKHPAEQQGEFREGNVGKDGPQDRQIAQEGDECCRQAHFGALADTDPVEQAQQREHANGDPQEEGGHGRKNHTEVLHGRQATDGGGEEVTHQDKHASQRPDPVIDRLRRHRHDSPAFGEAGAHLGVFEGEQHEDRHGQQHKETGKVADAAVEDARNVVDRRTDIGKDDRPAQNGTQLTCTPMLSIALRPC